MGGGTILKLGEGRPNLNFRPAGTRAGLDKSDSNLPSLCSPHKSSRLKHFLVIDLKVNGGLGTNSAQRFFLILLQN